MSLLADTLEAVRGVILLRKEVTDLAGDLRELTRAHTDTRERLIRIEALIEAATARRLPRG